MDILHDKDIREPLFDFLEETFGTIRIIEEKTMGRSRADIIMVTPKDVVGIEIKSDADTYTRLAGQVKDYDKYFDRNIVVVGTSHAMHIEEHVPQHWGIITVEQICDAGDRGGTSPGDGIRTNLSDSSMIDAGDKAPGLDFYMLRQARENPKDVIKNKLRLLWRPELYKIQMANNMPKYKDKSKLFVADKISAQVPDKLSKNELNLQISAILMERDYTTVEEDLTEYRKGELQKAIEAETDPQKKLELMIEQADKKKNFRPRKSRRRR